MSELIVYEDDEAGDEPEEDAPDDDGADGGDGMVTVARCVRISRHFPGRNSSSQITLYVPDVSGRVAPKSSGYKAKN